MTDEDRAYIKERLSDVALFQVFSSEELDQILPYFELRPFAESTTLFEQGDRGDSLLVVIEGTVDIRKESVSGKQTVMAKFGRGSIVGEMAIIDQFPRSATARVTANSKVLILTREGFEVILQEKPPLGIKFLREITRILAQRLRRASGRFSDIF